MRVKICGLTRIEDALLAAECGADFLGMIFVPGTPRFMEPQRAAELVTRVRARCNTAKFVGVFRNASTEFIRETAAVAGLDLAQLHGEESNAQIAELALPVIKTLSVGAMWPDTAAHSRAEWLLFDTHGPNGGGTGRRFDWSLFDRAARPSQPFLLAGGINPENVMEAIRHVQPDGIDLASGVESAPGVKDPAKLRLLFERLPSRAAGV